MMLDRANSMYQRDKNHAGIVISAVVESQMYPSVEAIKEFLAKDSSKPFICCEYTHAMGNSCGAMHKYTDLTDTEPKYQGGFIWDYIDQSIYKKDRRMPGILCRSGLFCR